MGVSPKEDGRQIALLGGSGNGRIRRDAMTPAATGSRIVEPDTTEDF